MIDPRYVNTHQISNVVHLRVRIVIIYTFSGFPVYQFRWTTNLQVRISGGGRCNVTNGHFVDKMVSTASFLCHNDLIPLTTWAFLFMNTKRTIQILLWFLILFFINWDVLCNKVTETSFENVAVQVKLREWQINA